jgi:hypothetical protein
METGGTTVFQASSDQINAFSSQERNYDNSLVVSHVQSGYSVQHYQTRNHVGASFF